MIVIKTRQPDPELEQKIRMLLEREHIEAEQISIDSWAVSYTHLTLPTILRV